MKNQVKLTAKEIILLATFAKGMDEPFTGWLHEMMDDTPSQRAVLGNLIKKNLVISTLHDDKDSPDAYYIDFTDAGKAAAAKIDILTITTKTKQPTKTKTTMKNDTTAPTKTAAATPTEKAQAAVTTANDNLKTKKAAVTSAKKVLKVATTAQTKAEKAFVGTVEGTDENAAAAKALTKTEKAVTAAGKKLTTAENAVAKATETLAAKKAALVTTKEKVKAAAAEAKAKAKAEKAASAAAAKVDNPSRNALVVSVELTPELCKKHGVPVTTKSTLFVHEYAFANSDETGTLVRERKEIAKEIIEIGIAKNTVQTQLSKYMKGEYPKNFSGAPVE